MDSSDIILVYGDAASDAVWSAAVDSAQPDAPRYKLSEGQLNGYTPARFGYLAILTSTAQPGVRTLREMTGHDATSWRFSPITDLIGSEPSDLRNRHVLPTLTVPYAGRMNDLDYWYTHHHVPEVTQVEGYACGRRYRAVYLPKTTLPLQHERLALYEITGDDPEPALRRLEAALAGMVQTDALDGPKIASWCYSPIK